MATSSDILRIARKELGTTSGKKYWDAYFKGSTKFVNGNATPFCACFTSWVMSQAGIKVPGLPAAYCPYICRDGVNKGKSVQKTKAQPGDIVLFDWDGDGLSDHVGIVESNQGSYLQTIEGNTLGGQVARRTRYFTTICHVFRPPYAKATKNVTTSKSKAKLSVDGWAGPATITALQQALDVEAQYIDGVISGQYVKDKPYHGNMISATYDGHGSITVAALRKALGMTDNGHWGKGTSKALQKRLIKKGYDCGPAGDDGYFGKYSCKALQRALNAGKLF